jgi:methyl halide transferase
MYISNIKKDMEEEPSKNIKTEQTLSPEYWEARWQKGEIGWDIGYASPAITAYADQLPHKNISILIPGCGNAYEALYLLENGFTNITLLDISPEAVGRIGKNLDEQKVQIICGDFFSHEGQYDLMIEQTFFCALPVAARSGYAKKSASLLKENGKIAGLLFNRHFEQDGPPFGGTAEEYKSLFEPYFNLLKMEACTSSIPQRQGNELFVIFSKKHQS